MSVPLESFHPAVSSWFRERFDTPTAPQARAWPSIHARRHTLIAAPTGSGKTLAAFLSAIDALVREGLDGTLPDECRVVYVSPLKALSNDVRRNLEEPLEGISQELSKRGLKPPAIRTLVRTGDTPSSERAAMTRRPPHILVTTPESLYILMTSEGGRRILQTARTVIVDEIHAVAGTKRGSHLALSLARLEALAGDQLLRVGLSATQKPVEEVARFLVGAHRVGSDGMPACDIVDEGHRRDLDLAIEVPRSPLEAVMSTEVWGEVYDRIAELIGEHRTTLVFVNTRRLAERVTRYLGERIGDERVAAHHGSLSRERRFDAEQRLKAGRLSALIATASLELGIDIGSVDLVCQIGSTRSIATLLQRVGRSGHALARLPKGRLFPLTRDELVEGAALLEALGRGALEKLEIPPQPLDILAQQIVAAVACEEWSEDALYALVRRSWPYRQLARADFDSVVRMLADGFHTRRGRRGALLHQDEVHGRLRGRRGSRIAAITSGGAIPDTADYHVVQEPQGSVVGTVNEDFAIESQAGDIFQLGNLSWKILKLEQGRLLVEDAKGALPSIPFWLGEAPGRSAELSAAVSSFRARVERVIATSTATGSDIVAAITRELSTVPPGAAHQIAEYLASGWAALSALPTQDTLILERFFDEAGDMHLVLHAPFGSRVNRAWGLALRKRFCRKFNFELQAAATEDAVLLSLGPTHSFPLEEVMTYLRRATVREVLTQALLDAPMFPVRWRWNASRSLAILRWQGGRKVPPRLQRMQAEDLVAVVFPDQLACLENIPGEREIPDHPLVRETMRDCLEEAMDVGRLEEILGSIERGEKTILFRELTEPSPLAHEILNARPYAFLDDAPLEERRTQAVQVRRWLDPQAAAELGTLDADAIARVRAEAWPDPRDADELHDALVLMGFLSVAEVEAHRWTAFAESLAEDRRAARLYGTPELWIAAERMPELSVLRPAAEFVPALTSPPRLAARDWSAEDALVAVLRGRLEGVGPVTAAALADSLGQSASSVAAALTALEVEGSILQGRFTPGTGEVEWCDRRLLARIHRATIERLRREIEPVTKTDFVRFLLAWQHVDPAERLSGQESVAILLEQLEGFEAPAAAWEGELLPSRLDRHDPAWIDALCQSGRFAWLRATTGATTTAVRTGPVRTTPIAILSRERMAAYLAAREAEGPISVEARAVRDYLAARGASFFVELAAGTGLLRSRVEDALAELVASGLVTSDSFAGLRALLAPADRRRRATAAYGMESAGRWSLVQPVRRVTDDEEAAAEVAARALLRRYGVVFRRLLDRESALPPWRDLLQVYRRLEARGEIRGGRFVDGFSGEQYALPEAVARLRSIRRTKPTGTLVSLSGADPLNLIGIATPGDRVAALSGNRILYRDGVPVAVQEGRKTRFLVEMEPAAEWTSRNVLLRRRVPARIRAYLGRPA
jgi:ATP-dependent Lhr-like helicase